MRSKSRTDERYMRVALDLAKKAVGLTNPNPPVGAVVVKRGDIVGRGYHKRCGLPHAEICALRAAGRKARGATLYVTMEPCDHIGRTGPCTEAIVQSAVSTVVIGAKDPNPVTNGKGIRRLNAHGIRTVVGVLGNEARALYAPFAKFITKRMSYITVKVAQSLDGKIATRTGDSRWVSSSESRRRVHALRGTVDAVMVGVNTVIRDDPSLLSKSSRERQPARIVVDSMLRTPPGSKIFSRARSNPPVYIATTRKSDPARARRLEAKGARILYVDSVRGRVALRQLCEALGELDIMHILVEGGGELVASLIKERLVDELLFFIAPKIIGGKSATTSVEGAGVAAMKDCVILKDLSVERSGPDVLIRARV